jgi:hypothetical protein
VFQPKHPTTFGHLWHLDTSFAFVQVVHQELGIVIGCASFCTSCPSSCTTGFKLTSCLSCYQPSRLAVTDMCHMVQTWTQRLLSIAVRTAVARPFGVCCFRFAAALSLHMWDSNSEPTLLVLQCACRAHLLCLANTVCCVTGTGLEAFRVDIEQQVCIHSTQRSAASTGRLPMPHGIILQHNRWYFPIDGSHLLGDLSSTSLPHVPLTWSFGPESAACV